MDHILRAKETAKARCNAVIEQSFNFLFDRLFRQSRHEVYLEVFEKVNDLKNDFDMDQASSRSKNELVRWLRILANLPECPKFGQFLGVAGIYAKVQHAATDLTKSLDKALESLEAGLFAEHSKKDVLSSNHLFGEIIGNPRSGNPERGERPEISEHERRMCQFSAELCRFKPMSAKTKQLVSFIDDRKAGRAQDAGDATNSFMKITRGLLFEVTDSLPKTRGSGGEPAPEQTKASACSYLVVRGDLEDFSQTSQIQIDYKVKGISVSHNGKFCFVETASRAFHVYRLLRHGEGIALSEIVLDYYTDIARVEQLLLVERQNRDCLLISTSEHELVSFDLESKTVSRTVSGLEVVRAVQLEHSQILIVSTDNEVVVLDLHRMQVASRFELVFNLSNESLKLSELGKSGLTRRGGSNQSHRKKAEHPQSRSAESGTPEPTANEPNGR